MKLCHSLKFLWRFLHCKVLLSHRIQHMASASSNLKQKTKRLLMASDPSCVGNACLSHQCLLSVHQNKFDHLHGQPRCSHTEVCNCVPYDHECPNMEYSACVSDGHGCASPSYGDALCDQSECFSKRYDYASDAAMVTPESLYDVGGDVVHEGHGKCANDCFSDGIRSLSIADRHDATCNSKAISSQFNDTVRKSSRSGNVQDGLRTESMHDVNGWHEMALNTGSVNDVEKQMLHCNGDLRKGHLNFLVIRNEGGAENVTHASDVGIKKPAKRPFCKRCEKAQDLCICDRFKGVVRNKIKITILQNPKEKHHAVGSARVALLGLENVALIDVPEIYSKETFRIRPKVPGSKRSLAGRGGKKMLLKGGKLSVIAHDTVPSQAEILQMQNLVTEICANQYDHSNAHGTLQFSSCPNGNGEIMGAVAPQDKLCNTVHSVGSIGAKDVITHKLRPPEESNGLPNGNALCGGQSNEHGNTVDRGSLLLEGLESLIPPGTALLYPSDKAIELLQPLEGLEGHKEQEEKAPCHLIVLDGTWSKARRIYFENPWLQSLPHYKLSLSSPSLYEGVRKQPKPGCLSTLESIVYALKVLEPDTEGLDGLLEVFDSMVEDQRRCKQMKGFVQECGPE